MPFSRLAMLVGGVILLAALTIFVVTWFDLPIAAIMIVTLLLSLVLRAGLMSK